MYKLTKDGYYIYEDHNISISETDLQNCKNDKIDVDKIRKERTELLKKVHGYLGSKDFMKFVYLIDSCPYNFYTNNDNEYETIRFLNILKMLLHCDRWRESLALQHW